MELLGYIKQEIIDLLELKDVAADTPIYIGPTNIDHIKNRHPYEYDKYYSCAEEILNEPDYVGLNKGSITYVKLYKTASEYVRVAVRVSTSGCAYVKTLHILSTYNAENYIERGTLKKLDN